MNQDRPSVAQTTADFGALTPMLAPSSIAVVGASERAGNLGGVAIGLLLQFGFHGPVWPVNPNRDNVLGLHCYPRLDALPYVPDLAVLAVPADASIQLIEQCGALGIRAAVIWAGGFAEVGGEGMALQSRLVAACRRANVRLCGPNCLGIMNASIGLMATFGSMLGDLDKLTPGVISMVSQSGGISGIATTLAQKMGFGFRVTVSCGNEADLSLSDFVHAIVNDDGTRIIALYVEGIADPVRFIDALAEAQRRNRIVVILKAGASEESGRAALAHTGKLAGTDRTFEALFREFGAIRVWSVEELLDVCLLLATIGGEQSPLERLPAGRRIVTTTFGGGSGVLTTDLCVRRNLLVRRLGLRTITALDGLLTPLASTHNPIDLTPQSINDPTWRARLPMALQNIVDDDEVDLFLFMAGGMGHRRDDILSILGALRAHTHKPVAVSWMAPPPGLREELVKRHWFLFEEHARAVRALAHVADYAELRRRPISRVDATLCPFDWSLVVDETSGVLPEHRVAALLHTAGLPVARGELAETPQQIDGVVARVGLPVAVKGISPTLTHRAQAGLLALGVDDVAAVTRADARFRSRVEALGEPYTGSWIQTMVTGGFELIITALRDPDVGVLVGVGVGGSLTELIDDIVFARAPLEVESAIHLLGHVGLLRRRAELLSDVQRRAVGSFVARFSALAATAPWQRFTLEVNPLKVNEECVIAVDGLLVIEREPSAVHESVGGL